MEMINTSKLSLLTLATMSSLLFPVIGKTADLIASSDLAQIFFDDTTFAGNDWRISGNSAFWFLRDEVNNNVIMRFPRDVDAEESLFVDSSGDISLAEGTVFIDKSLNHIGIGTVAPTEELTITSSDPAIAFRDLGGSVIWEINSNESSSVFDIANVTSGNAMFRIEDSAPSNTLVIDDTGGVGIGTATPRAKLDVRGDIEASFTGANTFSGLVELVKLSVNNTSPGQFSDAGFVMENIREDFSWAFRTQENTGGFAASKQGTGAKEFEVRNTTNVAANVELHLANGARNVGGQWLNASSRNYKKNIHELSNEEAMQTLRSLKSVKYQFKRDDSNQQMVGFIAEDVPALLATQDRKTVDPLQIVAVLTKALQSQDEALQQQGKLFKTEMKTKDAKIADMEERLSAFELLKQRLDKMEARFDLSE